MTLELRHPSGRLRLPTLPVHYTPPSADADAGVGLGEEIKRQRLEAYTWPHQVSPPPRLGEHTDEMLLEELRLERSLLEQLHQQ